MYIIKKFGLLDTAEQLEILECFKKKDSEDVLLQHYENTMITVEDIERNINDELMEEIDQYFDDFCMDLFYYKSDLEKETLEDKIKLILLNGVAIDYSKDNEKEIENIKDKLLRELKENNDLGISDELMKKIKYTIFAEINNNSINKDVESFVNSRSVFKNNVFISTNGIEKSQGTVIWYKPKNKEEYISSMKLELFYSGIIADKNLSFEDHSYAFVYEESDEDYDLIIIENKLKSTQL